ncbi:hypothetical protein CR513_02275, partial [Mucuna pruriens]
MDLALDAPSSSRSSFSRKSFGRGINEEGSPNNRTFRARLRWYCSSFLLLGSTTTSFLPFPFFSSSTSFTIVIGFDPLTLVLAIGIETSVLDWSIGTSFHHNELKFGCHKVETNKGSRFLGRNKVFRLKALGFLRVVTKGITKFVGFKCGELDLVLIRLLWALGWKGWERGSTSSENTLSINAKVEVLIRDMNKGHMVASLHKSEGSHDEGHYSERNVSSGTQRLDRYERQERHGRNERVESEGIKVRLVTLKFSDYALVWWNQVLEDIRRVRRDPCESWAKLKRLMRETFVSSYYTRASINSKGCSKVPRVGGVS